MMSATKEIITTHTTAFDTLKHSLNSISAMAKKDMEILDFYSEEDNKELGNKISEIRELQKIEEAVNEEDIAIEIVAGR